MCRTGIALRWAQHTLRGNVSTACGQFLFVWDLLGEPMGAGSSLLIPICSPKNHPPEETAQKTTDLRGYFRRETVATGPLRSVGYSQVGVFPERSRSGPAASSDQPRPRSETPTDS